jgi:small-conductance mechanosensitive channel
MLKQLLETEFSVNEIMLGILVILGIAILYKSVSTILRKRLIKKANSESVYKNMIKKTSEV